MRTFVLLVLLISSAYAPTPAVWKQTGGVGSVKNVWLNPDPAVVGKDDLTTIEVDYEADSVISGNYSITIYLSGVVVDKVSGDVCTTVKGGCPIAPGDLNATVNVHTPSISVPGEYRSENTITVKLSKTPTTNTNLATLEVNFTVVKA